MQGKGAPRQAPQAPRAPLGDEPLAGTIRGTETILRYQGCGQKEGVGSNEKMCDILHLSDN